LVRLNRNEEAIKVFDDILHRFGEATEPVLQEQIAKTLIYKGQTLRALKRPVEAAHSFQEVLRRFPGSPGAALQQRVEKAKAELKSLEPKLISELPSP
jgi:TolA-binding protein